MSRGFLAQIDEAPQSVQGEDVTSLLNKKTKKSQGMQRYLVLTVSPEWLKLEIRATTHFVEHKLLFISKADNNF